MIRRAIPPGHYPPATRGRVIVWGLLAAYPFGGMTWQALHYLAGFRRLGFDVWYVEDSDRHVYSPSTDSFTSDPTENLEYLARQMDAIGLGDRWIFRTPGATGHCHGARDACGLARLYRQVDAAFNLCGAQEMRPDHRACERLIYLQTDPVLDQIKVASGDHATIRDLDTYQHHLTYGMNLGAPDCPVPIERYDWRPTRPPVSIDWWRTADPPPAGAALTTIGMWKHSGSDIVWGEETWRWSKEPEFRRFRDVAARARLPLELAVSGIGEDEAVAFRRRGWRLDSAARLSDPANYRAYIRDSAGEFTVAKEQYVRSRSGWFSDRSVCYLAAGRPVITQSTGFEKRLPSGEGLFSFSTEDEALAAIEAVATDYQRHSAAAVEIARSCFDADVVLPALLRDVGLA